MFTLDDDEEPTQEVVPGQKYRAGVAPKMREKTKAAPPEPSPASDPSKPSAPVPPSDPTVRKAVENLALFVSKQGKSFEGVVRSKNEGNPTFRCRRIFAFACPALFADGGSW